jgi:hypothetical protein
MMMRRLALALACVLLLAPLAEAGPKRDDRRDEGRKKVKIVKVTRRGDAFCFDRALVRGDVRIASGRCYTTYLIRTRTGGFLVFGPQGPPMVPPGQLVRLNTPAGRKVRGRLFYWVPIATPITVIPVDTIRYVPVIVTPTVDRLVFGIPHTYVTGRLGGRVDVPFEPR